MDDYTRKVDSEHPRQGAFINCDAAVKSLLEIRRNVRHYCRPYIPQTRSLRSNFDITEDGGIDDHDSAGEHNPPLAERHVPLLYSPLPLDLPTMNKDVLILMAAYEGNVDRYVRLRRPVMIPEEAQAVIRGIYHNTTFAKWWSLGVKSCTPAVWHISNIRAAVNARLIMNNDLSAVFILPPPYLIWYPLWPLEATLEKLADMNPAMHLQIAHACIVADYRRLYDTLGVRPSWILWWESRHSYNPYYKADLERRSAELGFDVSSLEEKQKVRSRDINQWCTNRDKEPTDRFLWRELAAVEMVDDQGAGVYDDGFQANATDYNLFICSSETMRAQLPTMGDGWVLYEEYE